MASINPISTAISLEMQPMGVGAKTIYQSINKLDNDITATSIASLKAILEDFLELPVVEAKVKEVGLLVEV